VSTTLHAPSRAPRARLLPAPGHLDWVVVGVVAVLCGFGLLMLASASSYLADDTYGNAFHFPARQAAGLALGVTVGVALMAASWRQVRRLAWPIYGLSIVGLLLVFSPLGYEANGAARWISLGGLNLQPSEFAKIAVILIMAHYLDANAGRLTDVIGVVVPALGLIAPLLVLLLFEPDFGSTVILAGLTGLSLLLAGLRWRWVGLLGLLGAHGGGVLILIEPYRLRRLTGFLDPFADPEGAGYQVVQAWIAMAMGGVGGEGLASGVAQRGFLPEAHTDFIAAVVTEELGAPGWVLLVVAYALLLWRGTVIATRAPDMFGTLLAGGVTGLLGMQVCINLGVVAGFMPAKGLVLPFMSYGASAIAAHAICVALLLKTALSSEPPAGERA
jgi:cell division protein FtsW